MMKKQQKKKKKKGTGRLHEHEQIEPEFVRITREGSVWMLGDEDEGCGCGCRIE